MTKMHGSPNQDKNQESYMKPNICSTYVFDIGATMHEHINSYPVLQ